MPSNELPRRLHAFWQALQPVRLAVSTIRAYLALANAGEQAYRLPPRVLNSPLPAQL